MNEQELCQKRLIDLSKQANRKGIVLFSGFLNLNELNIYHQSKRFFETETEAFGGVPCAERQMIAFIPDALYYEWEYPIAALRIVPVYPKFAEKFGHRDVLGAIMKLGVDRSKIGDILIGDDASYLLLEEEMASYFKEQLDRIRQTVVRLEDAALAGIEIQQELTEREGIVTSNRLDSVVACVHRLSRSQALELFRREKVFVNGKLMQNSTYACHPGDIVSVRGFGRFVYQFESGETNKGRIKFQYGLYGN